MQPCQGRKMGHMRWGMRMGLREVGVVVVVALAEFRRTPTRYSPFLVIAGSAKIDKATVDGPMGACELRLKW